MCSNLHPKASWERYMWAGHTSPGEVQHFASSAATRVPAVNWSLILLHDLKKKKQPTLIKPLKRRIKTKVCIIFIPVLVTAALRKSVRKEVRKVGCCAHSHQQLFWSSSSWWEGDLKCAMRGKQSSGCIKDIEGSINHISGYLFVSPVQTLCVNIRRINK